VSSGTNVNDLHRKLGNEGSFRQNDSEGNLLGFFQIFICHSGGPICLAVSVSDIGLDPERVNFWFLRLIAKNYLISDHSLITEGIAFKAPKCKIVQTLYKSGPEAEAMPSGILAFWSYTSILLSSSHDSVDP